MSQRIGRKMNDGNMTGVKQDRYRHSDFEYDDDENSGARPGMSRMTPNTIGGHRAAENRGRKGDQPTDHRFTEDSPYENGGLTNWGNREGWDDYFWQEKSFRSGRQGGGILAPDETDHSGRGPKGYSRKDERILEDVCEMLARSSDVDASQIEVEVKGGCVFLSGSVEDRHSKRMAELEIENISGVKDVQNLLTLQRGQHEQNQ
jgi:hypothetical protein